MKNWQIIIKYICTYIPIEITTKEVLSFCEEVLNKRDGYKNNKHKKTKTKKYEDYPESIRAIVEDFIKFHNKYSQYTSKEIYPTKDEKVAWCKEIETILKDNLLPFDEIILYDILIWSCKDDFWNKNIISLRNLRKKSDRNGNPKILNLYLSYLKSPDAKHDSEFNFQLYNIKENSFEEDGLKKEQILKLQNKREKIIKEYDWNNFLSVDSKEYNKNDKLTELIKQDGGFFDGI